MNVANALATVAFQTARIIASHDGAKGQIFDDGSVMLQRQGSGRTYNACIGPVYLEVSDNHHVMYSSLFYEDGKNGPQHSARAQYHADLNQQGFVPAKLERDALDWIELHTRKRPSGIRAQTLAYMYGGFQTSDASNLLLQRFRYDPAQRALIEAETGDLVARLPLGETTVSDLHFDPAAVEVLVLESPALLAVEKALRIGFHECDRKRGADYCMRRLTWLASCFYEHQFAGEVVAVFVLQDDAEKPAELKPLAVEALAA